MPEFIKKYNFDSLYICLLLIIYNIWVSDASSKLGIPPGLYSAQVLLKSGEF
jgi:hypothetical protein